MKSFKPSEKSLRRRPNLKAAFRRYIFLPAIGIFVRNIPEYFPIKLIKEGYQIFISEITILELSAKGSKYVIAGTPTPREDIKRHEAIVHDDQVAKVSIHGSSILLTSFKLRKVFEWPYRSSILSSAINRCDALVTEDEEMKDLKKIT